MSQRVICYPSEEAWVEGVTAQIVGRLRAALAARRRATLLLAGGSTPEPIYRRLAQAERVDWANVHFFWGDERCVPPDDPESNFGMARDTLLAPLGIAPDAPNVHRFPTEDEPHASAAMYDQNLRLFFKLAPGELPRFDLALLGMGEDGHTASLFPESPALEEGKRLAMANDVPSLETTRLTVTFPLLNAARCLFLLVRGTGKAPVVAELLADPAAPYPVARLRPTEGDLLWLLDAGAASRLPDGTCEEG